MNTFIYAIAIENVNKIKIGFSNNPEKRLKQLQTANAEKLIIIHIEEIELYQAKLIEKVIHKENLHKKISGEWFSLTPEEAKNEITFARIRYQDDRTLKYKIRN